MGRVIPFSSSFTSEGGSLPRENVAACPPGEFEMKKLGIILLLLHVIAMPGIALEWGVVNDQGVRIRKEPTLEGAQIGSLSKGERVTVLGRTDAKMKMGEMEAYWYFIHTEKGLEGWAYGFYIDVEVSLIPAIASSQQSGDAANSAGPGALSYLGRYVHKNDDGAGDVLMSPDGRHVYTASRCGSSITCFSRNTDTGALVSLGQASFPAAIKGTLAVAISPDGKHVYTATSQDGALWWFSRDPKKGALANCRSENHPDLKLVTSIVVSPDGSHVYAAAYDANAIVVFS
jgi:hypothetical protein